MIVEQILKKITPQFETDATGHDIHHILRVLNVARKIPFLNFFLTRNEFKPFYLSSVTAS